MAALRYGGPVHANVYTVNVYKIDSGLMRLEYEFSIKKIPRLMGRLGSGRRFSTSIAADGFI